MKRYIRDKVRRRGDQDVTPSDFPHRFRGKVISRIAAALFVSLLWGSVCSADTATISVSATIPSGGFCWFTNAAALDFGSLDPANPVDVAASTTINFRCLGFPSVTYYVDDDDGQYETGPDANRMRHASLPAQFLPYGMDLSPRTATISWSPFTLRTLTVSGTVKGVDYQGASPGNYSDTVVLTIVP